MIKKDFIWYFLYFVIFIFATFNGITILKTKCFSNPLNRKFVEGKRAVFAGILLIILGVASLIVFIIGFIKFMP